MSRAGIELQIGGQTLRLVTDADPEDLKRCAAVVDRRLKALELPAGSVSLRALLLVALDLAHDLEQERKQRIGLQGAAEGMLGTLLRRVDDALERVDSDGNALPEA